MGFIDIENSFEFDQSWIFYFFGEEIVIHFTDFSLLQNYNALLVGTDMILLTCTQTQVK